MKRKIYGFYSNDPQANDQGGGAEHFRCIYRMLSSKNENFKLISAKVDPLNTSSKIVDYISETSHFGKYYINLFIWFYKNRKHINENDIFHFHRNYCIWPKYLFCRNKGKTIISYHNTTGQVISGMIGDYSKFIRKFMVYFEKKALNYSDLIIYVGDRDRKNMKNILGLNHKKTIVIPAAFNNEKFNKSTLPNSNVFNKILTIGRISHQKNFELALEAFEKSKKINNKLELTIAGDGELKNQILKRITKSKYQEDINYIGLIAHDKVPELISQHGMVLVSSRYEASPTIVKEAIASLRPIITTDVGDVNIWVQNDRNGYICEHNSSDISSKIIKASNLLESSEYDQAIDPNIFSEKNIMNLVYEQYLILIK